MLAIFLDRLLGDKLWEGSPPDLTRVLELSFEEAVKGPDVIDAERDLLQFLDAQLLESLIAQVPPSLLPAFLIFAS